MQGNVLIRRSRLEDWVELERLARMNGHSRFTGKFLLAEMGGRVVAAASLDHGGSAMAEPGGDLEGVGELLAHWAHKLRKPPKLSS